MDLGDGLVGGDFALWETALGDIDLLHNLCFLRKQLSIEFQVDFKAQLIHDKQLVAVVVIRAEVSLDQVALKLARRRRRAHIALTGFPLVQGEAQSFVSSAEAWWLTAYVLKGGVSLSLPGRTNAVVIASRWSISERDGGKGAPGNRLRSEETLVIEIDGTDVFLVVKVV